MAEAKTTASSEHIFEVLRLVTSMGRPIGASEVASTLGLSQTTAYRALLTLLEAKAIDRSFGGSKFHTGILTRELLDSLYNRFAIRALSYPLLRRLAASTGETASLAVAIGWYGIRIAAIGGWKPNRALRMGKYTPLNAGSGGRCLLAFLPDNEQSDYLMNGPKIAMTKESPIAITDLRRRIENAKKRGYEIDVGGVVDDIASVSIPVRLSEDRCVAVVTIEGPRFQFDPYSDPRLGDWVSSVAGLEAEIRNNPAKYESPFSNILAKDFCLPVPLGMVCKTSPA